MRIFLMGYMGCGKSTAGKQLANKLHLNFLDLDKYIEQNYRQSIPTIFRNEGEEKFRELEHLSLQELLKQDNYVLSLGGGTPCFYNNMDLIKKSGISVYLKMSVQSLVNRLIHAKNPRPLIKEMTERELEEYISAHLPIREHYYSMADYTIKGENLNMGELELLIKDSMKP